MNRAFRSPISGRVITCEWWIQSRRQCERPATVEIPHSGFEAPHRFCAMHGRWWNEKRDYVDHRLHGRAGSLAGLA